MINESTFEFLESVGRNNNREWFQENKHLYEQARANVINFTSHVISKLSELDPLISNNEAHDCVFRIYRDTRFSKDKTPYKTHFAAAISPNGRNFKGPGYYIHIQPGNSFITAGCWMPEALLLKSIRQEIDYNGTEFQSILTSPDFRKFFSDLDYEDYLKTTPKGYDASHPDIRYLRLKSFTASHSVKRNILTGNHSVQYTIEVFKALGPFVEFLRRAIS